MTQIECHFQLGGKQECKERWQEHRAAIQLTQIAHGTLLKRLSMHDCHMTAEQSIRTTEES